MAKASRGSDQFPLRLPAGMREQIKRAAEDSGRSMNSEIIDALREYYPAEPDLTELIDELEYSMEMLLDLREQSSSGDISRSGKFSTLVNQITATNEALWKLVESERRSRVFKLDHDVVMAMADLNARLDLPKELTDGMANNLIRMGLSQINDDGANLRIWLSDGIERRVIEIGVPPQGEHDK